MHRSLLRIAHRLPASRAAIVRSSHLVTPRAALPLSSQLPPPTIGCNTTAAPTSIARFSIYAVRRDEARNDIVHKPGDPYHPIDTLFYNMRKSRIRVYPNAQKFMRQIVDGAYPNAQHEREVTPELIVMVLEAARELATNKYPPVELKDVDDAERNEVILPRAVKSTMETLQKGELMGPVVKEAEEWAKENKDVNPLESLVKCMLDNDMITPRDGLKHHSRILQKEGLGSKS